MQVVPPYKQSGVRRSKHGPANKRRQRHHPGIESEAVYPGARQSEKNEKFIEISLTEGTLVSLRGQAALGNRFPKRFGNDLPAHFPTEAHPLESPAVAGRETAQLPNLAPVARRQFVHLLPRKTLTGFPFCFEGGLLVSAEARPDL